MDPFLALMIIGIVAIVWLLVRTLFAGTSNLRRRADHRGDTSSSHSLDTGATNYEDSSSSWGDSGGSSSDGGGGDGGGGGD